MATVEAEHGTKKLPLFTVVALHGLTFSHCLPGWNTPVVSGTVNIPRAPRPNLIGFSICIALPIAFSEIEAQVAPVALLGLLLCICGERKDGLD